MKKVLERVWDVIQFFIICYVVIVTIFIFSENKFGYPQIGDFTITPITEESHKNLDKFNVGDLMIIQGSKNAKVGDVVFYYEFTSNDYEIKYDKLVDVSRDRTIYTVGVDEVKTISRDRIIGTRSYKYVFIGKVFSLYQSKKGFIFGVILPIFIVFAYHLYKYLYLFFKNRNRKEEKVKEESIKDEEII